MDPQQESRLKDMGIFGLKEAKKIGISHQHLYNLLAAEKVHRISRGLYIHQDAYLDSEVGFQIACAKFGKLSAIGGISALFHYNLIEQVPEQTWVLVPHNVQSKEKKYRLMRTKRNIEKCIIQRNGYRIVSIERAIIEGLKFATKFGERTVVKAARLALETKQTTEVKLGQAAKELGLSSLFVKYFEVILP